MRLNVNLLGEAILGEQEAAQRMDGILELLGRPEVGYVSVKISAICSRLNVIAYEDSVSRVVERLRRVLHVAAAAAPAKFVNLDMEEYRDLQLTVDSFIQVLSEPSFAGLDAGIVLQAYLPDSCAALQRLAEFARERKRRYGSIVKVRLVKGANLAMERVESQLRGWPQAPFTSKTEVDANFKRLLDLAIDPRHEGALRVGVASHNLFDIGWPSPFGTPRVPRSRSRCWKEWPTRRPWQWERRPATSCFTRLWSTMTTSRPPSPTLCAASTRTPRLRTSWPICST